MTEQVMGMHMIRSETGQHAERSNVGMQWPENSLYTLAQPLMGRAYDGSGLAEMYCRSGHKRT